MRNPVSALFFVLVLLMPHTAFASKLINLRGMKAPEHTAATHADSKVLANKKTTQTAGLKGKALYRSIARVAAKKYDVPYALVNAVMHVESRYNTKARGYDGEIGLMQMMPATARMLGLKGNIKQLENPHISIPLGVQYLAKAWRLGKEDICTATMKYRAGHGEKRFSFLSVKYCKLVRSHMKKNGVKVTGIVPKATFGFKHKRAKFLAYNGRRRTLRQRKKCLATVLTPGRYYGKCVGSRYYR